MATDDSDGRDLSGLADALADAGADGYLIDADGSDANQRYVSDFSAPDPFVSCYAPGGVHLLVSTLEYGRATDEASAASVSSLAHYDYRDRVEEHGRPVGRARTVAAWLDDHGVEGVLVPERFPLGTADGLRSEGVDVDPDYDDVVETVRARKTEREVEHVRTAQAANEAAIRRALGLIAESEVVDGRLRHDGEPLTSERVRHALELTLLERDCALDEAIVACGADAADPHERGSGRLRAGEPIIVDVFPRHRPSGYHADTTRTVVRGEPSERVREWHRLVDEARRAALDRVEPGATGAEVHAEACEVFEAAGLPTLRSDPSTETGFIHSTGHGVGLDVHELPRVSPDGGDLEPGHVVTVEPGLYDPEAGGVRVEDIVVVTEEGYENLTTLPTGLDPGVTERL